MIAKRSTVPWPSSMYFGARAQMCPGRYPCSHPDKLPVIRKVSTRLLVLVALAIIGAVGGLASMIWFQKQPASVSQPASDSRDSKVANQFVDALNARFEDSSLFNSEVRLGRRGNMI